MRPRGFVSVRRAKGKRRVAALVDELQQQAAGSAAAHDDENAVLIAEHETICSALARSHQIARWRSCEYLI
jgi:hypothetical protein